MQKMFSARKKLKPKVPKDFVKVKTKVIKNQNERQRSLNLLLSWETSRISQKISERKKLKARVPKDFVKVNTRVIKKLKCATGFFKLGCLSKYKKVLI